MPDSDSLYHRLFSHPRLVEELVREFVPEALAEDLDFHALQRVNAKFHIGQRSARRRESDVIWRLPTRKGGDVYLYLLIEFQSDCDWWMAVRTQVYQGLLWQQVIDEKKLKAGARLPPTLLLVLYNGVRRWDAATELRELIPLSPDSPLWPWQPQIRYYLLDMGAFSKDELARRSTLVSLLFRLEQRYPLEELRELLGEVVGWFRQHEGYERLRELFAELVREGLAARGMAVSDDMLEIKTMKTGFSRNVEEWYQQSRAAGRADGLMEGRAQGIVEGRTQGIAEGRSQGMTQGITQGKADALLCLLAERFGELTPSLRNRISAARLATIDRWFKRAIVATDLHSVFSTRRS